MSRKRAGLDKRLIEVCEAFGWRVDIDSESGTVELWQASPAGEDFSFEVDIVGFVEEVDEYANDFDEEEHVANWIDAKRNGCSGVPSIKELVEDADDIKRMLVNLAEALEYTEVE